MKRTVSQKKKVFVGLSGGVDSSVSALLLKEAGHDVVGVFIKVWQPDFLVCDWEKERLDAMRVAAHLGIPFLTFDAEEVYKKEVADYMIEEYKAGRTPNPDVMCNRHVKFGAFLDFAKASGADMVATGHYAQVMERDGRHLLLRGADEAKDQSYFLWTLTQDQLSHIMFPVGHLKKPEVRAHAARAGLPTATKHDSQGICFLGQVDMEEFLSHYVQSEEGDVYDTNGVIIGTHSGALFYTLGQRHGFSITKADTEKNPYYVVAKDMQKNSITVDTSPHEMERTSIELVGVNIIPERLPVSSLSAEFRYRQKPFAIEISEENGVFKVLPKEPVAEPSSGQSCVLYNGDECLGGGVVA